MAPAASVGFVRAAGIVVGVGNTGGGNITGGGGGPPDDDVPEFRRFAAGGIPSGGMGPLAASTVGSAVPALRNNANGGAPGGCVGVAPPRASSMALPPVPFVRTALLALLACFLNQSKVRTVKIARKHITNKSALVQETTNT